MLIKLLLIYLNTTICIGSILSTTRKKFHYQNLNTTICIGSMHWCCYSRLSFDKFKYNNLYRFNINFMLIKLLLIYLNTTICIGSILSTTRKKFHYQNLNTTICIGSMHWCCYSRLSFDKFKYNNLYRFNLKETYIKKTESYLNTTICIGSMSSVLVFAFGLSAFKYNNLYRFNSQRELYLSLSQI